MRVAALGFAIVVGAVGCGNKKRGLAGINSGLPGGDLPDACAVVQDGCPCSEEGETLACGTVKEKISNYVICLEGVRTCSGGVWGACVADHEEKRPLSYRAPMQGGYATLGQGTPMSCGNLCDPGCQETDDDGDGLVVDPDLSAGPDGVTLPPQSAGGNCEDVEVTPDTSTVTITSITSGAIVATPNNGKVDFDATCSGGAPVEPSWTIDSYDRAVVSAHGVVTVYSGVAGPIKVKGSTASDSDTSTLTVKVVAGDTPIAAGTTTEVGKTLYPYNNTLFPLGLKAPLVQWSEGGITPTKVQVLLCYPKDSCTTFQYAKTFPTAAAPSVPEPRDGALDNTVPAWQIPQEIWSAFDQTAAGGTGQIIIRRQAGSTKYKQLSIDVQFAKDALRGTVYYTQYLRTLHTSASGQTITYSSSAYVPGQICEVGNSTHPSSTAGSQTRAIDLSTSAATNIDPFAKGGYTAGCPVCHSVSADGGTVVSGGQNWQTSGGGNALGIDDIGLDAAGAPKFTGLFAAPNYSVASTNSSESSGEDSRGFSYAAISPDGALVLQGPTFWGSTQGTPSSNNVQSPNLLGVAGAPKPYFFSKTDTPNPGMGVQFATTGSLPAYTVSGSGSSYTLTASAVGALTIDGVTMSSTSYSVLVKDESGGNAKNNGIYTVSQVGSGSAAWKLRLRSDSYSASSLKPDGEVRVSDGALNRGNVYYISSPTTGTITPGSTALTFSQRVYPAMVMGSTAPRTADYATTGPLTPATVTQSGNVLTGGYASGLVVDGHTLAVGETLLVQDQANQAQNGIYTLTQLGVGGTGAPTTASYATTAALPANTNSSGVLTGTAVGALPTIDGITPAVGDTILVKNEGAQANNGIYTVTTLGGGGSGTPLSPARCATTGALPANGNSGGTLTANSKGALGTIDGVTLALGDRVLVKNEGTQSKNGIYTVTNLGSGSTKWVLTRATDANSSIEVYPGLQVPVTTGTANGGKTFYISSPATGTITVNTTAITFAEAVPWQLTRKSPYDAAGGALDPGLQVTVSSGTANVGKTFYISSPSFGTITVNTTPITWSLGTSWQLTRTANADATGEITPGMEVQVANGAVNAGRVFSVTSPTSGTITINTTAIGFSYGLPSMMAPVMSPDGKKIAYVNGDADVAGGLAETGWRRGLSMFNFDQATMAVSRKKRLINNWNASTTGTPVKWPFFEGDSRSLLYVETDPNEYCSSLANSGRCSSVGTDTYAAASCSGDSGSTSVNSNLERACYQAAYGSMSPTTRGFWPGRIFSIDTSAADPETTRTELSNLNDAEDATDADKAYQPTVLPFTAGGKRWVIFTSPRAYGNQFNQKSSSGTPTDLSCAASMLWVSALDDATAGTTDRSHPAFFMPGQQVAKITTATHYVNERGYLVRSPCKATGTACGVDEECCGYDATPSPTAACRAPSGWDPATGAPAKKCAALSGTCSNKGESCATSADCCNMASCVNFACETAGSYEAATFTREYVAECPTGQLPRWMVYTYHLTTGGDSKLTFSAQTSDDLDDLDAATVVTLGSSTGDVVSPAAPESIDLGAAFDAAGVSKYLTNLRMLVKLEPSSDGLIAPILRDWQVRYTCEDSL